MSSPTCSLQSGCTNAVSILKWSLKEHHVQSLFKDPRLWEFNLCVLLFRGIHNGFTGYLRHFLAKSVKRPLADLPSTNNILDKFHPACKAHCKLVKQLQVLEQVIIRLATREGGRGEQVAWSRQLLNVKYNAVEGTIPCVRVLVVRAVAEQFYNWLYREEEVVEEGEEEEEEEGLRILLYAQHGMYSCDTNTCTTIHMHQGMPNSLPTPQTNRSCLV